jgi:cytidine deaminase
MLQDGSVWTGANVENITLNLTQCAERNLVMLLVQAKQEGKVVAVAVYGPKSDRLSPCGSCRQLMSEYLPATTRLIFRWGDAIMNAPLSALLPYSPEVKL